MVDNTWASRYEKAVDNKYRNFNMGGDVNYRICNLYCNFEITNLDQKDYLKGITASSSSNLLHLNPIVDTDPPKRGLQAVGVNTGKTTDRKQNIYIDYRFKGKGGLPDKYKLIDIFIRTPSKVVLSGKRYQMEVCLIFTSDDESRYLVICVPMNVSPNNKTEDPLQKDLFKLLSSISDNFPTKGKTYSIENAPNWNPLIFFPIKTGSNASFYTWVDPTTNDTVKYVQYVSPITVPYNFYETFTNTLSGSINSANKATTLPPQTEHADLEIYFNKNQANEDITKTYKCEEKTNPLLKEMINFKKKYKPEEKVCPPGKDCKIPSGSNIWLYILTTVVILIILLIVYLWYSGRLTKTNVTKMTGGFMKMFNKQPSQLNNLIPQTPKIPLAQQGGNISKFDSSILHPAILN